MGRDTLKHVLSQQLQLLERDFAGLLRSSPTWNDLQARSLDIISLTLHRLSSTVETLPSHQALSVDMRHELRNQLTVIMGYAQLMQHRRAGELPIEASVCLQKIMAIVTHINTSLDQDKQQARNS